MYARATSLQVLSLKISLTESLQDQALVLRLSKAFTALMKKLKVYPAGVCRYLSILTNCYVVVGDAP